MLPEEDIRQIEAWLDGALPPDEQAAFSARMRGDPAFAAEVALHEKMRQAVREKDIGAFRRTVDALLDKRKNKGVDSPGKKVFQLPGYILAFAAALLLVLAAIWFFLPRDPSVEQLYAKAFQPPEQFNSPQQSTFRDTSQVLNQTWQALNAHWQAGVGDLEKARITALEIARGDTSADNRQAAFYAACVIALAQQKPEEALQHLQQLEDSKRFAEEAVWYSALAHVQIAVRDPGHKTTAVEALEKVERGSQPEGRHQLAADLLKALKNIE